MVQVHIGAAFHTVAVLRLGHIAAVRFLEVLPVALAAAEDSTVDGEVGSQLGGTDSVVDIHEGGTTVTHGASAIYIIINNTAVEVHRRGVHEGRAATVFGDEVVGVGVVGTESIDSVVVVAEEGVVVTAVGTAVDVVHLAAADVDTGVAVDAAADVVAAVDVVDTAGLRVADVDVGHASHVSLAAAAEEAVLDGHLVGIHQHIGRHTVDLLVAHVGEVLRAVHAARVATAEDILHGTFLEDDVGHAALHVLLVVAAEDGTHGEVIGALAVEEDFHIVHHTHTVAAAEDGVDHAAVLGVDVDEDGLLEGRHLAVLEVAHRTHTEVALVGVVVVTVAGAIDAVDLRGVLDEEVGAVEGVVFRTGEVVEGRAVGSLEVGLRDSINHHVVVRVSHLGDGVGGEAVERTHTVVAGVEGAENLGVATHGGVAAAVEVGEVAAAVGVAKAGVGLAAHHRVAVHLHVDGSLLDVMLEVAHDVGVAHIDFRRGLLCKAHVGFHTAAVGGVEHLATVEVEVGVVVRGHQLAHIFVVGVVGLVVGVSQGIARHIAAVLVAAVVVAVAAAIDILQHHSLAVDNGIGAFVDFRSHIAADVVAAVGIAEDTAGEPQNGGTLDVGHTAATVDIFHHDARTGFAMHDGTDHPRALILPTGEAHHGAVLHPPGQAGSGFAVAHVAGVAAAVDAADTTREEVDLADGVHGCLVAAAEEHADVVAAYLGIEAVGVAVDKVVVVVPLMASTSRRIVEGLVHQDATLPLLGDGVVVEDVATAGAVHRAQGTDHLGHVAAEVAGVDHAAVDGDVGMRAVHQVAAAEEVADTELAAVTGEVGVLDVLGGGGLGVVHVDEDRRGVGHRAAVVVAAEDSVDRASVDINGDSILGVAELVGGDTDKGVLGAAKERVDKDIVIISLGCIHSGKLGSQLIGIRQCVVVEGEERLNGHTDGDMGRLDVGHGSKILLIGHAGATIAVL